MSRWFRFYADALRNPKVLRLSDKDFRLWVRLLAIASENDGKIASVADLKLVLAMRLDHVEGGLQRLINGGLIDALDAGFEPHGWAKFQYKSDVSTERVHKHREKRNVSETPPETETDTDRAVAKATGASAVDVTKAVWDSGKVILKAAGHDDRQAGSIIGRFRKTYSDSQVLAVLSRCEVERPSEPVEWITKALQRESGQHGQRNSPTGTRTAANDAIARLTGTSGHH